MSAEAVRLFDRAPMRIHFHRPLVTRPDAFAPVIFVGEAGAGPAHHWHFQLPQRRDHVVAIAARVGNRRVLADPDSFVDAMAEVLGELTVDVSIDPGAGLVGLNGHRHGHRFGRAGRGRKEIERHQAERGGQAGAP